MTEKEALRFVFAKLCAVSEKIEEGAANKKHGNAEAALLDVLPPVKEALAFLYDFMSGEEIEAAITEAEAME